MVHAGYPWYNDTSASQYSYLSSLANFLFFTKPERWDGLSSKCGRGGESFPFLYLRQIWILYLCRASTSGGSEVDDRVLTEGEWLKYTIACAANGLLGWNEKYRQWYYKTEASVAGAPIVPTSGSLTLFWKTGWSGAFGPVSPSTHRARIWSGAFGQNTVRGLRPVYTSWFAPLERESWQIGGLQKISLPTHTEVSSSPLTMGESVW